MIDFISLEVSNIDTILKIHSNTLLNYKNQTKKVNKGTAEIFYIEFCTYLNLEFHFLLDSMERPRKLYIKGSFHKYYNKGFHNANDFTYNQFIEVIEDLNQKFGINPHQTKIQSLEYGINIVPSNYITTDILKNTFNHKRKSFIDPIDKPYRQSGTPKNNPLVLKLYDKAAQYPEQANTQLMRWENKYSRMRLLNSQGIYTLADLIKIESHIFLQNDLIIRFKELLIYDFTIDETKLSNIEQKNILNYKNPNYWNGLNKRNYLYHKRNLYHIIKNYSNEIQKNLSKVIKQKLETLLPKTKIVPNTPLYIIGIGYKKCKVTGVDISNQKKDSFLLSHTGLKHLLNNDRKKYDEIRKLHLTEYWNTSSIDKQIEQIAHNIRNVYNNRQIKLKRIYPKGLTLLFELPKEKHIC